ncbi:DNA-deoxyinosine glycosylase [uncultured Succinatimonas sp.]|uniref:DNA-deoxyinosine glycosylase n=1 Tax=uncultured Succinatimonas sp. TaxID=1262973 RepID=UPI0025DA0B2C|nr:DNA-deoxyinosine glycosylase [uncultured Succinatimonas sp.]
MRISGLKPFINKGSRILILGSMPSIASLQDGFYYAHPQNRMWKIIAAIAGVDELKTIEERKQAALKLHLAFFDVIESCEREGSLDSNIKAVKPNDINSLLLRYPKIKRVITNGNKAKDLFLTYNHDCKAEIIHLPSTSPANAVYSLDRLKALYLPYLVCQD